jgi:hypothetical protein
MKPENKIPVAGNIPVASKAPNHRPTDAKAVVVPAWAPQPSPMTREEIRKLVIDQIG